MKKILATFAVIALIVLTFASCGNNNDDRISQELAEMQEEIDRLRDELAATPEPMPTPESDEIVLLDSGFTPVDLFLAEIFQAENIEMIFYHAHPIIFTTTAEENGLGDTFMFIEGTVHEIGEPVELNEILIVRAENGFIAIGLAYELIEMLGLVYNVNLFEIGETYRFFFRYTGFSGVLEMPMGMFVGLHEHTFAVDEPEIAFRYADMINLELPDGWRFTTENEIGIAGSGGIITFAMIPRVEENVTNFAEFTMYQFFLTSSIAQLEPIDTQWHDLSAETYYPTLAATYLTSVFGIANGASFVILGEENSLMVQALSFYNSGVDMIEILDFVISIRFVN